MKHRQCRPASSRSSDSSDTRVDGVILVDLESTLIHGVDAAAARLLGRPARELVGTDPLQLLSPEGTQAVRGELGRIIASGGSFQLTVRLRQECGLWVRTRVSGRVLILGDRELLFVRLLDHTGDEEEQASDELEASRQRLALHVERTPLGVIDWDLDFRVLAWNPGAERIFGYTAEEALGRHPGELILPDSARRHVDQIWRELCSRKGGLRSTNENLSKDGRLLLCEWYNTPLVDPAGRILGVASLVQDVTERKQMEERLLAAQRMEAVGRLAGGVAHDFSNILTAIQGNADLLTLDLEESSKQGHCAREITKSALRVARRAIWDSCAT